ncbi:ABC transporter permease [Enterococcus gilvus]|nr:ABC transporter permease [Enterococcus gilvus]OJG43803.1 hypothetical protein RV02_GL002187 [Enterococcus gilvus]
MNIFNKITLQSMKKNRTRTLVTILGVLLSSAMIAAVATFALSLQHYMVKGAEQKYGGWQVAFQDTTPDFAKKQETNTAVEKTATFEDIGYGKLEGGKNPNKPYLFVAGFNQQTYGSLPIKLLSGRLPKSSEEVVIPAHIAANGGVRYSIGDTLSIRLGERKKGTRRLTQHDTYDQEKKNNESLTDTTLRNFKVVGICERPGFEEKGAPGYTVITLGNNEEKSDPISLFVTLKHPRKARSFARNVAGNTPYTLNDEVLRFIGASDDKVFNMLLYSIGVILIALIMVGSIFLIYNSFTISLNERMHQFGILASIGATPKQLRNSVLFEGLCIGAVGIPLGTLVGLLSIQIVITIVAKNFRNILYANIPLTVTLSVPILLAAAAVSLITILISAYIPAKKAARTPVMESIRQSNEVKISPKDMKMNTFSERLYGLEGMLALKNFKRNKKRYRTIVLSLALSVILFVSARSFASNMQESSKHMVAQSDYDIVLTSSELPEQELLHLYKKLQKVEGVTTSSYQAIGQYNSRVKAQDLSKAYLKGKDATSEDSKEVPLDMQFLEDHAYARFVKSLHLPIADYTGSNGKLIAVAKQRIEGAEGEDTLTDLFSKKELLLAIAPQIQGKPAWDQSQTVPVTFTDTYQVDPLPKQSVDKKPYVFMVIAPYQRRAQFSPTGADPTMGLTFLSDNPGRSATEMKTIIDQEGITANYDLYNVREIFEQNRNIIFVVNLFSSVFVVMIALIAIANVFNTISTNIKLRRRELAMLRSIGMGDRDFTKMMLYECAFYGWRALLLGVPVASLLSWVIYKGMSKGGAEISFQFPWGALMISILGVFLIVVITMLYAVKKIKKETIIEALRDDLA